MSKIKIGAQVTAKARPTKVTVSGTFQGYELEDQEDPTSICGRVFYVKDGKQYLAHVYIDSIEVCDSKPAEWSEEDENKLYQVMEVLLADKTIALRENPHCKALHRAYDELLDWLKSLRPQPHWKPSEKQMGALKNARYMMSQSGDYYDTTAIIDSLIADLQKLL